MALRITHDCIACAACVEECPNQAISEGPGIYVIDPQRCLECVGSYDAPHCIPSCPVDAIVWPAKAIESEESCNTTTTESSSAPGTTA